jgi:phosphoribosylformimino-5-aminoimidazole carboxamide ribotide isomerase
MFHCIPAIDVAGGRVVRLTRGDPQAATVYGDDPVAVAARFREAGASWVHLVDLDAAFGQGALPDATVRALADLGLRIQVGGGIRDAETALARLESGAHRVVVGSAAANAVQLAALVRQVGADAVAVALDVDGARLRVAGWREDAAAAPDQVVAWSERAGVRTFVVTAIARDGTEAGPDVSLSTRFLAPGRTVLASGGIGTLADLERLRAAGLSGAIVGRALYAGRFRLEEALALC